METLSHLPDCEASLKSKEPATGSSQRIQKKSVRFAPLTADILTNLFERTEFRFPTAIARPSPRNRPILKYSDNMTECFRRAGSAFARVLSALGAWCSGVTSDNPNIRSDMYKQLVAQIRGTSPYLRQAGESVLQNNVHGMWLQLVDDFGMKREHYTTKDLILCENAAQLIGIVLSNHRFLEKLDVLDVQTFVLDILTQVNQYLDDNLVPNDRFRTYIWLLSCEVSGWWEDQAVLYSQNLCERLYAVITRINIIEAPPPVQRALLEIFRIVFVRYPDLRDLSVEKVLDIAWDFMWHDDEQVRKVARTVVTLIADYRGGHLSVFQIIKKKCRTPALLQYELCTKLREEMRVFPVEALDLWMTITRLVKENIINLAQDRLKVWLRISQETLSSEKFSRTAGIMICFLTYYCQSNIEKDSRTYDMFAQPFRQRTQNPVGPLKMLDASLNAMYYNSPLQEPIPVKRAKPRPKLKIWARMTVDALDFNRHVLITDELSREVDKLVAHVFCHWDNLVRALMETKSFEGYDEDQRTQDIIDICGILGKAFPERIRDEYNDLGKLGKHAVHVFWFNLMATILYRDRANPEQIFPVEVLRSLLPMILAGLYSTQMRIRQSTYRFLTCGDALSGMRWLVETDGIELLKAVEHAREEFEAETCDKYGRTVHQINDFGTMMLNHVVDSGRIHPTTLKPIIRTGNGNVRWVWFDPHGNEFPLGKEEIFAHDEREKVESFLGARATREAFRLKRKERDKREKRQRRARKGSEKNGWRKNHSASLGKKIPGIQDAPRPEETQSGLIEENLGDRDHSTPNGSPDFADVTAYIIKASSVSPLPGSRSDNTPKRLNMSSTVKSPSDRTTDFRLRSVLDYDKRMPPPSVNWRVKERSHSREVAPSRGCGEDDPTGSNLQPDDSSQLKSPGEILPTMAEVVQKHDATPVMESFIKENGKKPNLQKTESAPSGEVLEDVAGKSVSAYFREGDDGITILSEPWKERTAKGSSVSEQKRGNEIIEASNMVPLKRRKLKSDYCPAAHTTWKPVWLSTAQCYPVNQDGEELSDIECLRGDGIHRNADKLKQILETGCMYIPSHCVDDLVAIAEETYYSLKRTKEYFAAHPKEVRIEGHEFA